MASFAEIMQQMQPQQQMTPVPMPYVPGMPQAQQVQLPQVGPVDIAPQQLTPAPQQDQAPQAPVAPEEMEQRKQGWKTVLDGFMAQPNAKELMMMMGMKLMQGRRPGQSVGSQFADAAGTGMMANSMYKQNQVADADKQRKQGMEDQKHDLDVRRGTAQADKAEAENDFYSKTRTQALEEINLGIENLKKKGKFEDARLVEQEFQNGNLKEAWELTKQDKRSAIWARGAQVKIQQENAAKVPSAQQTSIDRDAKLKKAFRIEPGESPEDYESRIARLSLGVDSSSKVNRIDALLNLADLTDDKDPRRQQYLDEAYGLIQGAAPTFGASGKPGAPAAGRGGTGAKTKAAPAVGTVKNGFRFKGGDPAKPENWSKI